MNKTNRNEIFAILIMVSLFLLVGFGQSWSISLSILNMCIISAIMSMGINIQWGYAGIFNVGIMGFTALGGLAAVLVSHSPVGEAWRVGGIGIIVSLFLLIITIVAVFFLNRVFRNSSYKYWIIGLTIIIGLIVINLFFRPAVQAIEDVNPAVTGFLGGLGLPIIFSWVVGGLFAAGVAFVIGKITLGLRSDYLAIATLGISEIIIAVLKHEDWLSRGVKNVIGLKRPVPYEIDLQKTDWFISLISYLNTSKLSKISDSLESEKLLNQLVIEGSSIFVKLSYMILFTIVLLFILYLANKAQVSPWGRMMRAIRDNETSANAMGKDVVKRHLQVFVIGSGVVGIAGAMLITQNGLFTPASFLPLRYTFLIWVMVIVGGSGNNVGSILGGFVIWFVWIEAAPASQYLIEILTATLHDENEFKLHLIDSVPYFRYLIMGSVLLLIMRYRPKGILPEKVRHS
ncbi:MAG: branched-chain amino acid ABC transporter permease [Alphaproteobacteria bacterium]|nr:branched-chain amino acid ABC transporter permease [Alphaproteobacteria bacterium]